MSRKDFQLIAQVLRDGRASYDLVKAMADALATTNPRFDRNKFVQSAYYGDLELILAREAG